MIMGKHKVKDKFAYFFPGLVVLSIFQAVVIVQPAMGQCIEPAQKQECSPPQTIETIFYDNCAVFPNNFSSGLIFCPHFGNPVITLG
jgi:hypothetical protein